MRIPKSLRTRLAKNEALSTAVGSVTVKFETWIKDKPAGPFFPEYTDHGMRHLEDVLATAYALMTPASRRLLGPEDVAALVLAVLLHDCVMHLTEDGFLAVIAPECPWQPVVEFDDKPWHELWTAFVSEATRWDARKIADILGDDADPVSRQSVAGAISSRKLDGHHRLIGEFLRRHHHVLAHHIALHGVPGPSDDRISLADIPGRIPDIAGVIARSHGIEIRDCLGYLKTKHTTRHRPRRVLAPYHMALVRIADYLQLGLERASAAMLQVQSLRTPLSRREWAVHGLDMDVEWDNEDGELLVIHAEPPNVDLFLRLQKLLQGLQAELDLSWAVLGEVYGGIAKLRALGMTKRRVQSNIDDVEAFAENQDLDYIPRHAAFKTRSARMLNLLVKPLYNDDPSFAIREMIQNSVDAVRERWAHEGRDAASADEPEPDVLVTIGDGDDPNWVVVEDRGIGMTVDTILDYFLTAGASLRDSDGWKDRFTDEGGESKVLRSGKFGVGALAVFLLGPTIEVSTRHVDSAEGVAFEASIGDDTIELRRVERPVGTTIRVRLDIGVSDELLPDRGQRRASTRPWEWYCLDAPAPTVHVLQAGTGERLPQAFRIPPRHDPTDSRWHQLHDHDHDEVRWTYARGDSGDLVSLVVCNGLAVRDADTGPELFSDRLYRPMVSVSDRGGTLPLNLTRTGPKGGVFPFDAHLAVDVARDGLAYCLLYAPTSPRIGWGRDLDNCGHPGIGGVRIVPRGGRYIVAGQWVSCEAGLSLADPSPLPAVRSHTVLALINPSSPWSDQFYAAANAAWVASLRSGVPSAALFVRVGRLARPTHQLASWLGLQRLVGLRALIVGPAEITASDVGSVLSARSAAVLGAHIRPRVERMVDGAALAVAGEHAPRTTALTELLTDPRYHGATDSPRLAAVEYYLDADDTLEVALMPTHDGSEPQEQSEPGVLAKVWQDVIRHPVIPFDLEERKDTLAHAYKELDYYIKKWERRGPKW